MSLVFYGASVLCLLCVMVLSLRWRTRARTLRLEKGAFERFFGQPVAQIVLQISGEAQWRQRLDRAGLYTQTPLGFLSAVLQQCLVLCIAACLILALSLQSGGVGVFLGLVLSAGVMMWRIQGLSRAWQRQRRQLQRELPFLFDLLVMALESGAGFNVALQRIYALTPSPQSRLMLARLLECLSAGMGRQQALQHYAEHMQLEALHQWAWTLEQADSFGISLAPLLRIQATQLRERLLQQGEQKALQAPLKMLLPLSLCLMPCTFIVLLLGLGAQLFPLLTGQA
ncbi:type II secretion system F family protein [Alcaligenes endophyticus]|uniref:Type II secretion system F family protein n=1 Tax=Alcaligenes endophyticus TaxID=1929088 RepID=A0ABT8EK79_9BURK|nr:type II secretion system F family protein [Alcaligenes endophyticus]MCX5591999.1 type II secretion system F family protein [Alcaligenes endophyticus]MDN4121689.1 type II secretion system F family protein [Alcaligenes endophyticus]